MFIQHRNFETRELLHIIDTKDDQETRGQLTEVVVMLPSGRKVRLIDAPEGVDGFDIIMDLARTVIEPQASNATRIWFRQPIEGGS